MLLSASEIRSYTECARKRYYSSRSFCCLRTNKANANLLLGAKVHEMLAYYYGKEKTRQQCIDVQEKIYELPEVDAIELKNNGTDTIFNCIHDLYQERLAIDLALYRVIHCEYVFDFVDWPIVGVTYHGAIDLIVQEKATGKVFFMEHKTCKDFRPEIYNRFDIQLHIYHKIGTDYCEKRGLVWGGIILNEIKKAKTERGYAEHRMYYTYSIEEMEHFTAWLTRKTEQACNPENLHEPCNTYMTCKMCSFNALCLTYGWEVPTLEDILTKGLCDEEGELLYIYAPREQVDEEEV